jgi:hypothetical protein
MAQVISRSAPTRDPVDAPPEKKSKKGMSDRELVAFLGRKIAAAMNDDSNDISASRKENFNYYTGQPYGNERDGYSKFVTREALETVEWVLPSVLRVFLSGDRIVVFDPSNESDQKAAEQETDITNHFVMKANNNGEGGFIPLHHWMKDALMYPNGYLKVFMEEVETSDVGVMKGLNGMALSALMERKDTEILEQRESDSYNEQDPTYDVRVRTRKKRCQLRLLPVPPEECLVDSSCTTLNLDEAKFVCHRVKKTHTQLINEGYDADDLAEAGAKENQYNFGDEKVNRLFYSDEQPTKEDADDDPSMRDYWVHECYTWFDDDGDGVAEQRIATMIGCKIFENKEINYQPMVSISSILMQHKHTGMSYLDIAKDLQLLSSVLTRQLLDNVYKINVRRKVFSEDALTEDGATMEAILNTQAEFIPVRGLAANAFVPEPAQSIVGELLPVIQHFNSQMASRTGVSPQSQVDGNALQEVRQEVFSNALDRASQRIEMLVRIFAETGYRQLMRKVHQLLRSHWDIEKTIQLRGEWVQVDPQGWRDRTDMTVNVGLGFNTKQLLMGMLVQILSIQKEAAAQGLATLPKVYHTLDKLINAAGIGNARQFFVDPASKEFKAPDPPPPDPNMILAQAQAKALEQEQNRKDKELQIKAQADGAKLQSDTQIKQADFSLKQAEHQIKLRELALREQELIRDGHLKEGELTSKIANTHADTQLKLAQADKTMAEAVATAAEASETYQQALKVVAQSGEANDMDDLSIEMDSGDTNDDSETDAGTETSEAV